MYSAIPPSYLLFEITPLSSKSHCIILNTTNVSKSKIITGIAFLNIEKSNVNSAKKAKERLLKKEKEVVMEEPTKPAIVEDPVDIQLLKEIRDLLKENKKN